jgi:hypothetical protein
MFNDEFYNHAITLSMEHQITGRRGIPTSSSNEMWQKSRFISHSLLEFQFLAESSFNALLFSTPYDMQRGKSGSGQRVVSLRHFLADQNDSNNNHDLS